MIICVLDGENVIFYVDVYVFNLLSVICMCCMMGIGLLLMSVVDV